MLSDGFVITWPNLHLFVSGNHSCEPNAEVTFPFNNSTLVLKALHSIQPGEVLTLLLRLDHLVTWLALDDVHVCLSKERFSLYFVFTVPGKLDQSE